MALSIGTRLGPYEIVAPLGAGGMGEVYRARDTKLGRDVALKILPDTFTHDPERLARFRREAQVLASLNHPHIGAIYGLDEANGQQFLVLELVDGESLDKRIARGRIPVDDALVIAKQIADALEAAHEKGIIHRDLKPANIALTRDGNVKVLDFGLAKAMEPASGTPMDLANSPTITSPAMMTSIGMVLGTAAYMSPEQAKGRPADKRSDVWAFGCVLYEMLTGRRAFVGEGVSDTLAAVLRGEPDWTTVPADTPSPVRRLLRRCLEKDRKRRLADAADARLDIDEALTVPASEIPTLTSRRFAPVAIAALTVGALLAALVTSTMMRPPPPATLLPSRFALMPPPAQPMWLQPTDRAVTVSPDGTLIVYRAGGRTEQQLVVRALNELDTRPLGRTSSMSNSMREPFISPDGRWIGFFTVAELRKIPATGGPPITICKISADPRGASWGPDDTIVFAVSNPRTGLLSVPAGGGEPKVLTTPDTGHEGLHVFPSFLPDGSAVLFTITAQASLAPDRNAQVAILDLKTGRRKTLIRGGSQAEYVSTGHLVYAAAGALNAVRFDLARLEVGGAPVPVVDHVLTAATGEANFAISRGGTLVYVPGSPAAQLAPLRSLIWVDRQGREESLRAPARPYSIPRLSPDGTRIALDIRDQDSNIWIWDFGQQTLKRLTFHPTEDTPTLRAFFETSPVWTPDGRRVIWSSTRAGGNPNLYWQAADGTGTVQRLTTTANPQFPTSVSPDSTRVVLNEATLLAPVTGTSFDVSVLALGSSSPSLGPAQSRTDALIHAAHESNAEISPDGRWLAYQSNESGQAEIYVRPFPNVDGGRWQISTAIGTRPVWSRSGQELFYLDGNNLLTAVAVQTTGSTFRAGNPARILEKQYYAGFTPLGVDLRGYDVSLDGQRFLMIKENAEDEGNGTPASMVVVLNWFEELKARVPTK
jgi:eukaryotic-like serine/threonine-protein kinase